MQRILKIFLFLGGVLVVFFLYHTLHSPTVVENARVKYWERRIHSIGATGAYNELLSSTTEHFEGHYFGTALYQEQGISGMTVCDDKLQYACLHEMYGRALAEYGLSIIKKLDTVCTESADPLVCEHGIGHGLVGYFGYTKTSALQSVAACKSISEHGDVVGACESGLFMEYFNRTMLPGTEPFPVSEAALYAPCEELALGEHDMPQCVFEFPRLWFLSLFKNERTPEHLKQLGLYCQKYDSIPALRTVCARGAAEIVVHAQTLEESKKICSQIFTDIDKKNLCELQVERLFNLQ